MSHSSPETTPVQNPPKRSGGTAEMLGAIVGVLLAIAVPLVIGILLLRRPKA